MVSAVNTPNYNTIFAPATKQQAAGIQANFADAAAAPAKSAGQTIAAAAAQSDGGVSTYDFTHMTPREMQGAANQLFKSGKIDITQLFMLQNTGVPFGKLGPNGEFIQMSSAERATYLEMQGNTPINYVDKTKDAMAFLEQTGRAADPQFGYDSWKGILAAMHDNQGTISGVNIIA